MSARFPIRVEELRGLWFDESSWDGSDFFLSSSAQKSFMLTTERVRDSLSACENIVSRPIEDARLLASELPSLPLEDFRLDLGNPTGGSSTCRRFSAETNGLGGGSQIRYCTTDTTCGPAGGAALPPRARGQATRCRPGRRLRPACLERHRRRRGVGLSRVPSILRWPANLAIYTVVYGVRHR